MQMESYLTAPFWAKAEDFLRKLAFHCNVKIDIYRTTGFIKKTYYYKIKSEKANIERFIEMFEVSVEEYNKG